MTTCEFNLREPSGEVTITEDGTKVCNLTEANELILQGSNTTISGSFTTLTDTPSDYSGQANKIVSVKSGEDGLEFIDSSGEADTLQSVTDRGDTTTNDITANSFIKTGGTPSQFLKADGSVDSSSYLTTETDPVFSASEASNITAQDITNLGNLSGVNTGDQDLSPYEILSNKSTNTSLGNSDTLYPTQNAVKTYVDTEVGNIDLSGLVPYTGATTSVDLGSNSITAEKFIDNGWGVATITGDGQTAQHNNYRTLLIDASLSNSKQTWNVSIADGTYDGQLLTVALRATVTDQIIAGANLLLKLTPANRAVYSEKFFGTNTETEYYDLIWTGSEWLATDGLAKNDWTGGLGAWASGTDTTASGSRSMASGENSTASGENSFAIGKFTTSSSEESFAGGTGTEATGRQSFVYGNLIRVSGNNSVGFGTRLSFLEDLTENNSFFIRDLDFRFRGDLKKMYLGESDDSSIYYDGDDLIIDSQEVGSGDLLLNPNGGNVGINTTNATQALDINDDSIRVRTAKTPASATASGTQGQIAWDANYIYVCTATNTWVRAALNTW